MNFLTRFLQIVVLTCFTFAPIDPAVAKTTKKHSVSHTKRIKSHSRHLHKVKAHPSRAADMFDAYAGKDTSKTLAVASTKALVINQNTNEVIYAKNLNTPTPIASVTKLMTAMVVLDAKLNLQEQVSISSLDVDTLKGTSSRLPVGSTMTRENLLNLALIASENRAASALATSYPGGKQKFVHDMNLKAASLGMTQSHFSDSTGLDSSNVSTAQDLARMVHAAYQYPVIRQITTTPDYDVQLSSRPVHFNNTNALVRSEQSNWEIGLSKTGYISEAGRCLVMQATIAGEPLILVLLDSVGKLTRIGDAKRIKKWVEHNYTPMSAERHGDYLLTGLTLSKSLDSDTSEW